MTENLKRPRLENYSEGCAGNKSLKARSAENSLDEEAHFLQKSKKRATSATAMPDEPNLNRGILDELAERLGNFHESARALADCLQTRNVTRKTDQSMIEAAKCMFHKLLGEASDDLERVTPQSCKSLHRETIRKAHRCPCSETVSGKPSSRSETLVEKSCSCPETVSEKPCSRSEKLVEESCSPSETPSFTVPLESALKTRPSREPLEQVADDDFRKQLELSVPLHIPGEGKYEFEMSSFNTTILNFALRRS